MLVRQMLRRMTWNSVTRNSYANALYTDEECLTFCIVNCYCVGFKRVQLMEIFVLQIVQKINEGDSNDSILYICA